MALEEPYKVTDDVDAYLYWKVWVPSSPLAAIGRVFHTVPASTGAMERMFSVNALLFSVQSKR